MQAGFRARCYELIDRCFVGRFLVYRKSLGRGCALVRAPTPRKTSAAALTQPAESPYNRERSTGQRSGQSTAFLTGVGPVLFLSCFHSPFEWVDMRILISNDDGYFSPGIEILARVLAEIAAAMRDANVSIESLLQMEEDADDQAMISIVTHSGEERCVNAAIVALSASPTLRSEPMVMRILGN